MIAQIAREHPESLNWHLGHVAEIEAARQHAAGHPSPPPEPVNPRDLLQLSAIRTWQALTSGQPAPTLTRPIWTRRSTRHLRPATAAARSTSQRGLAGGGPPARHHRGRRARRPAARRAPRHHPHRLGGDLVRPHHRAPDPDRRQVPHPPQVPALTVPDSGAPRSASGTGEKTPPRGQRVAAIEPEFEL